MDIVWASDAWDDYLHWQREKPDLAEKINELIKDIRRKPFEGLGKPEPLKGKLAGWWSRRVNSEHRLVYKVEGKRGEDQKLSIAACRYHYE
ncbi:MAG: Txe/YoeB family addiction module toxin [Micropepsaceae bacterium]